MILLPWIVFICFILYLCVFSSLCCTFFLRKETKHVFVNFHSALWIHKKAVFASAFLLHLAQETFIVKPCGVTKPSFPPTQTLIMFVLQPLTVPCLVWSSGVCLITDADEQQTVVSNSCHIRFVLSFICCLSRWQYCVTNVYPQTINGFLYIKKENTHKRNCSNDDYRSLSFINRSHWLLYVSVLVWSRLMGGESLSRPESCFSPVLLF